MYFLICTDICFEDVNLSGLKNIAKTLLTKTSLLFAARAVTILQELGDQSVCEGDIAQLEVKFSQENVAGIWQKDGQEIQANERIHIVIDKTSHMLLIEDATKEDAGKYSFLATYFDLLTSGHLTVQCKYSIF